MNCVLVFAPVPRDVELGVIVVDLGSCVSIDWEQVEAERELTVTHDAPEPSAPHSFVLTISRQKL
jgi:hypothetical protein